MKRIVLLFVLAAVTCAATALLFTSCAANVEEDSNTSSVSQSEASSEMETVPEETSEPEMPAQTPSATVDPAQSELTKTSLQNPDLQGKIQSVEETFFSLIPITVTGDSGGVAVAAAGIDTEPVEVDITQAVIETMRIYNGGHEEPQPADASALQEGQTVNLFGSWQGDCFVAQTVRILLIEDDPA